MKEKLLKSLTFLFAGLIISIFDASIDVLKFNNFVLSVPVTKIVGVVLIAVGLFKLYEINKNEKIKLSAIMIILFISLSFIFTIISRAIQIPLSKILAALYEKYPNATFDQKEFLIDFKEVLIEGNKLLIIASLLGFLPKIFVSLFYYNVRRPLAELSEDEKLKKEVLKNARFAGIFNYVLIGLGILSTIICAFILNSVISNWDIILQETTEVNTSIFQLLASSIFLVVLLVILLIAMFVISIMYLIYIIKFIMDVNNIKKELVNRKEYETKANEEIIIDNDTSSLE